MVAREKRIRDWTGQEKREHMDRQYKLPEKFVQNFLVKEVEERKVDQ